MNRVLALLVAGLAAGCIENVASTAVGLTSYQVNLTSPGPSLRGTPPALPVTVSDVVFDIFAIDAQGQQWPNDVDVNVFVSFAGNKIGQFTACGDNEDSTPLATLHLTNGVDLAQTLHLIKAYGETSLWFETAPPAGSAVATNFATGASPPIYFPNPTIPEVQTPFDLTSPTAFYCSPFNAKHLEFDHATSYAAVDSTMPLTRCTAGAPQSTTDIECQKPGFVCGTDLDLPATDTSSYCLKPQVGNLVVTSVFPDSYVVADTGANFHGVTGMGGFNHLLVYTQSQPDVAIKKGRVLADVGGNLSKFVGFSELNFPLEDATDTLGGNFLPPVYPLSADEEPGTALALNLRLLRLAGATVSLQGKMCFIDQTSSDWSKYHQFVLDMSGDGANCEKGNIAIALPGATLGTFDPLTVAGALVPGKGGTRATITVMGMLQNASVQNNENPTTSCHLDPDCSHVGGTCVEGLCKGSVSNYWTIRPRDQSDISPPIQ